MNADLTNLAVTFILATGTVLLNLAAYFINKHIKDAQLRQVLSNAVKNSVGLAEDVARRKIEMMKPMVHIPGVPEDLQAQVQYVLDHAEEAAARFNVTPEKIAEKVVAQLGLKQIESPIAILAPKS